MFNYLLYYSFSKSRISNDELIKLLKKSRDWNKRQNITGILIYRFSPNFNRGNFLQIVEGSKKSVSNVWRRISKDSKHHTVTILEEGFNEKRIFPNWSMGFKNLNNIEFAKLPGFLELTDENFWANISDHKPRVFQFLKGFYDN